MNKIIKQGILPVLISLFTLACGGPAQNNVPPTATVVIDTAELKKSYVSRYLSRKCCCLEQC